MSRDLKFLIETIDLPFSLDSGYAFEGRDMEKKYKWETIEVNGDKHFLVKQVFVNKIGFIIAARNCQATYTPQYWQQTTKNHPDDWELSGVKALRYLNDFQIYCRYIEAEITAEHLKLGNVTPKYIQDNAPDLINHPVVQETLSDLSNKGSLPKGNKGQPERNSHGDIIQSRAELVFRVICYRQKGLTQADAMRRVLEENRNIIPSKWNDPEENLKTEVRRLSKHPMFENVGIQFMSLRGSFWEEHPIPWKKKSK